MNQDATGTENGRRGRPWWQICCGGCLVLIIALVVGGVILTRVIAGPGTVSLTQLPENFPKAIAPLHLTEVQSISYFAGGSKNKMLKFFAAPQRFFLSKEEQGDAIDNLGSDAQYIDTVTLTWKNLATTREQLVAEYVELFKAAKLTVEVSHDDEQTDTVSGITEGVIAEFSVRSARGAPSAQTADTAKLVVSYSNKQ